MAAPINIPLNIIGNATQQLDEIIKRLLFIQGIASGKIAPAFKQIGMSMDKAATSASKFGNNMDFVDKFNSGMGKANKQVRTFDMRLLSLLFGGMALKRLFGGALRNLFDNFKKVGDEQSIFNVKTMELSASWTFFKFSIIDALSQSGLFVIFIDGLVSMITWVSDLTSRFPGLGIAIVGAFAVLAGAGAVMMTIGQFKLFWDAVFGPGGFLGKSVAKGLGTAAGESGTVAGSFSKGMVGWQKIIGAGLIIYGIFDTYKSITDNASTPFGTIIKDALSVGMGAALIWGGAAGILASTAIVVGILISNEGKKNLAFISNILSKPDQDKSALESYLYGREKGQGSFTPEYARTSMDDSGNLVTKEELSEIMSDKIFESVKEGTKEGMQSIFGPQSSAWTGTPYTG